MGYFTGIYCEHLSTQLHGRIDSKSKSQLSTEEQKAIVNGYNELDKVQASGIRAAGQKFFTLQAGPRSIYGKKQVRAMQFWIGKRTQPGPLLTGRWHNHCQD